MQESRQITRSAGLVSLFTLLSRILGLLRDAVTAAFYAKKETDVFFVAFTIPNVLRRLTAEGALTVAFIPVFTEYREKKGEGEARRMLSNVLGCALVVLVLITLVGILAAPWVVRLFAYGFVGESDKFSLCVELTKVMFVFTITASLTALSMGVLNTYRHFTAPAISPALLNLVIIGTVFSARSLVVRLGWPSVMALTFGVVFGGFAQVALQLPFLAKKKMLVAPRFHFADPGVVRVGKLMLPSVFSLAIYELNVILARQFASFLSDGAISAIYYAQRLIEFPMGMFAVAIATVALPNLSRHAASGNMQEFKETYGYALRLMFFIILPCTAGLLALAVPLTSILFQRGMFSYEMTIRTAETLMGFLCGLWAGAGVRQTVPVFYALQAPKDPVKVGALSLCVYIALAWPLHQRLGTVGLALSVAGSSIVNFLLLLYLLRRRIGQLGFRKVLTSVIKSGLAAGICGVATFCVTLLGDFTKGGVNPGSLGVMVCALIVGVVSYGIISFYLKNEELFELFKALRSKI